MTTVRWRTTTHDGDRYTLYVLRMVNGSAWRAAAALCIFRTCKVSAVTQRPAQEIHTAMIQLCGVSSALSATFGPLVACAVMQ